MCGRSAHRIQSLPRRLRHAGRPRFRLRNAGRARSRRSRCPRRKPPRRRFRPLRRRSAAPMRSSCSTRRQGIMCSARLHSRCCSGTADGSGAACRTEQHAASRVDGGGRTRTSGVARYQQEQQPIGQAQPVPVLTVQQPQVQNMLVMVYDPASGQYVQKMMPMQLDPATGNYVPAQAQPAAAPTTTKAQEREAEKQRKAAEKAEKERQAEERRKHADELREERAARARKNDSLLGRVQNTAINTATREVTRQVTRGIYGRNHGAVRGKQEVIIDIRKAGAWSLKLRAPAFLYYFQIRGASRRRRRMQEIV